MLNRALFPRRYMPSTPDAGSTGSALFDYFWGTELYPRVGHWLWSIGWDIKQFTNCRCGVCNKTYIDARSDVCVRFSMCWLAASDLASRLLSMSLQQTLTSDAAIHTEYTSHKCLIHPYTRADGA